MRIDGEWLLFDDGVVRPVIRGEILGGNGLWNLAEFLLDTGADRTAFSVPVLTALRLRTVATQEGIGEWEVWRGQSLLKPKCASVG
jgi:hypothetical protein